MNILKNIFKTNKEELDISRMIQKSLEEESESWDIDEHYARYGSIEIWIANSPHADMKLNGRLLLERSKLRKSLHVCKINQVKKHLLK